MYIGKPFWFFQLFWIISHQYAAQNHPQLQILPKKLIRLGQNSQIWLFCMIFLSFPPKWSQDWLGMINFTQFTTFPIFCHQSISFLEKSQKFSFLDKGGGRVHQQIFCSFPTFSNHLTPMQTENDPQLQTWPKKWLRLSQNGHFCISFYLFPQNEAEIDSEWSISPYSQLFPSFATKASHFWRNLKNFHWLGGWGGTSAIFLHFPTFSNCFTPMWLKMTHNSKFGQKSGLDWVKMAIFAYFSIFSLKMTLRFTRNGQFHLIHNFSHLLPPKHIIFGEISKIFIGWVVGGVHQQFFCIFQLFQIVSHQCDWKWPTIANLAKKVA